MQHRGSILHLFGWDKKFAPPFIDFVSEHFDRSEHLFIIYGDVQTSDLPQAEGVIHYPSLLKHSLTLMAEIRAARKVILHGLFSSHLLYLLMLQPRMLKKCYWTIWGGDLYVHEDDTKDWRWRKNEWCRRFVVSRLGHFITQIRGDYELAQEWYGASGHWHDCFMYPSNLYRDYPIAQRPHSETCILLGNSASPTNHHMDAIERLRSFAPENIRIYCPLSYGDAKYGDEVVERGKSVFGERFIPLREFMSFEEFLRLLTKIDVAVFNHNRQQGMGSITVLLGFGKKVYLRTGVSSWATLQSLGVQIYDVESLDTQKMADEDAENNRKAIKLAFSEAKLAASLCEIFE